MTGIYNTKYIIMLKQDLIKENEELKAKLIQSQKDFESLNREWKDFCKSTKEQFAESLWLYTETMSFWTNNKKYAVNTWNWIFFEIWKLKQQAIQNKDKEIVLRYQQEIEELNKRCYELEKMNNEDLWK